MSYRFFTNWQCEYYPCHEGLDEVNCLFCFCPLYSTECNGKFTILPNGVKDCSQCLIPHQYKGYDYIIKRLRGAAKI